jgi:anthranilate/para-aminobenzoate synthase component II
MHGRASLITHNKYGIFENLPNPLSVGRYHSLIVTLNEHTPLIITATSDKGDIMALTHCEHMTWGVQFHPESILTDHGHVMMSNFLNKATS